MTDIEKKIADFIIKNYDEEEYSEPYQDYRVYIDGNQLITSQGEMTDVLFVHYTENEETGYDLNFMFGVEDNALIYIAAGSDEFIHVKVSDGEKFVRQDQ